MSSNKTTIIKGCLAIVGLLTLLGVSVAIFGVKAVTSALQEAERRSREIDSSDSKKTPTRFPDVADKPENRPNPSVTDTHKPYSEDPELAKRWSLPDVPVRERGNRRVENFRGAKNIIYDLHADLRMEKTFYCGCDYARRKPDLKGCGYQVRKHKSRAQRTEIEHVMPASRFGHTFSEWTEGHPDCERDGEPYKGRSCAERASSTFELMESDLYNLQPAVGEVNGDRLDYEWAEIKGESREYGTCDVEIRDQQVEPREAIRGDIARTYLYMAWAYPDRIKLSSKELAMFTQWDKKDPPSNDERKRASAIALKQGNIQPFIR